MIALGSDERVKRALTKLCETDGSIRCTGLTGSISTLLFALEESRPELAVLDEQSLGEDFDSALSTIHRASPQTRLLIVGDDAERAVRWDVLQLGVAGHLRREEVHSQLLRAINTIRRGEFWLSRSQSSQILARLAQKDARGHDAFRDLSVLTGQENRVLEQCLIGQSNKEIARVLGISGQTVKIHLGHIFQKLGVRRRAELLLRRWIHVEATADQRRRGR